MNPAKKKEWVATITLACVFLGALLAVAVRTTIMWGEKVPGVPGVRRIPALRQMYLDAQEEIDRLKLQRDDLQSRLSDYERAAGETSKMMEVMKRELDSLKVIAGLTKVKGPGIILHLEDSKIAGKEEGGLGLVHDYDLERIVNELKAGGAEAIALNGYRLIAASAIRCVGPIIKVNDVAIASPYEIVAIGEPKVLESAIKMPGGVLEELKPWGIRIKVTTQQKELIVPSYVGSVALKWAEPVIEGRGGK